jgi:hypothetical protein
MLPATVRDEFVCLLMETGNVSGVARVLGINRMTAYGWRDDPEFAQRWDIALDVSRQGLRERVVETAEHMGVGEWVSLLNPISGEPELDDDFEPVMHFETRHVDARILMKLMDKTMRGEEEDGPRAIAAVQVNVAPGLQPKPRLVTPEPITVDYEEVGDEEY